MGFEHKSNGQRPPVSRSWNLLYSCPYYYQSNLLVYLKFRYRIPEDKKESPEAAVGDDNPDITDYLGYNDLHLFYEFPRGHSIHLMIRGNISTGKGGLVLNYSLPVPKSVMSYVIVRFSHGYGESLVDYKKPLTRVGNRHHVQALVSFSPDRFGCCPYVDCVYSSLGRNTGGAVTWIPSRNLDAGEKS
jgi:phospholipase A1